jgi:hypothetical protein
MSDKGVSKLSAKDITTRIASDTLNFVYRQTRDEVCVKLIEVARKWGAEIPTESESQFKNEMAELFSAPSAWPSVEITIPPIVGGVSNSAATVATNAKAPGRTAKKTDSSKTVTSTRKAKDFRELVVPSGIAIPTCPTIMKSGDKKDQPCGKECNRVTDEHDLSDPECARLECGHMFCGIHVVKGAESGGGAVNRLASNADPDAKPVVYNNEGGSTKVNASAVGNIEQNQASVAGKATINRLVDKMKQKRAAAAAASTEESGPAESNE